MRTIIVTHLGLDGIVAAALLLRQLKDSDIRVTSAARIGQTLEEVAKCGALELHICGLGVYCPIEEVIRPLRALRRAKTHVVWYADHGHLDTLRPNLEKLARLVLDESKRPLPAIVYDTLKEPDEHSERLLLLCRPEKAEPQVKFLADFAQASTLSYLRYQDREAVPNCIRKLAFPETITATDRSLARQVATGEWLYLAGKSAAMQELRKLIKTIGADRDSRVLILGETGTGKETIARMIHDAGQRHQQPFFAVNCANFAESLLESQLFGHERGAFTGADARNEGVFEMANGGTLFLDEIGEMPWKLQTSLLRVLETGRFRRLSGRDEIHVDVRVMSATNRDLLQDMEGRRFRPDLYYRLNTVRVVAPAVRDIPEDIAHIAQDLIYRCCYSRSMPAWKLTDKQARDLKSYHWPGNVRQLLNIIERAVVLGERDFAKLVAEENAPGRAACMPLSPLDPDLIRPLRDVEREHVLRAYAATGRNKTQTAKRLEISINTLKKKLTEWGE